MIILILILGFILRLINLNQSLWLDEAITALAVKNNSFLEIITKYAPTDFHPPLYYLFLKLWTSFFGFSEISLRFPSIMFSLGTGYFIYLIAKTLFNKKIALLASLFWSINPLAVYYSQEARMYSMAAFLISGAIYFLIKKKYFGYILFLSASLYTDYVPFLILPAVFLTMKDKKEFFKLHLPVVLLFLPWLQVLFKQLHVGLSISSASPLWSQVVGGFDKKAIPLTFVKFTIGRISTNNKIIYGLIIAPISLIYIFTLSRARNKTLWLWLVTPILLGFIISFKISIFSYFRFLFVLPAFVLLLASGLQNNKLLIGFVVLVSVVSLLIFNLNPEFQREDWRQVASYLRNDPGPVLIPNLAQDAPIKYYYPEVDIDDMSSLSKKGLGSSFDFRNIGSFKTVYLFRYVQEIFDPTDEDRKGLERSHFQKTEERAFNGVLVWKYERIR